jgi:hypothetical protein
VGLLPGACIWGGGIEFKDVDLFLVYLFLCVKFFWGCIIMVGVWPCGMSPK